MNEPYPCYKRTGLNNSDDQLDQMPGNANASKLKFEKFMHELLLDNDQSPEPKKPPYN